MGSLTATLVLTAMALPGLQSSPTDALQIHVKPMGDNDGPGTVAKPLADLNGVLKRLTQLRQSGARRDIRVILHSGTYFVKQPVKITPVHLPQGKHSLTFEAAKGAKPLISGGKTIRGWKTNKKGMLTVQLPTVVQQKWQFRELFVSGKRRPRARHPNRGYYRAVKAAKDNRTGFTFKAGQIPKKTGATAELVFLHDWSISRVPVTSINQKEHSLTVAYNIGCKADHYSINHFEAHPRYYLENDPAFLDRPGEWYLDPKTGVLTYFPFPGEDPATLDAIAPLANELLVVHGTEKEAVQRVHFRGIRFAHSAWQLPKGGYASGQASIHEYRDGSARHSSRKMMPTALTFTHAKQCSVEDCEVMHLGLSGLSFGAGTHACRIIGNRFEDISANCINIGEESSRRVNGRTWWQSAPDTGASDHVIANNLIQNGGAQFYGSVGIWVGLAKKIHIHHNEVRQLPYTGISLGWMWSTTVTPTGGHIVEHNHIHHIMQVLSDGGGCYTLGRQPGTVFRHNHIHHIPLNAGRAQSNGMFLDQGSSMINIVDNLVTNVARSPLRFHQAKAVTVKDNILVSPSAKVPPYAYNRTDPKSIDRKDNKELTESEYKPQIGEKIIRAAGVEKPYRKRWDIK